MQGRTCVWTDMGIGAEALNSMVKPIINCFILIRNDGALEVTYTSHLVLVAKITNQINKEFCRFKKNNYLRFKSEKKRIVPCNDYVKIIIFSLCTAY